MTNTSPSPMADSRIAEAVLGRGAGMLPMRPMRFVSDIHGEAAAFDHLVRSRSGEVRAVVGRALRGAGSQDAIDRLLALVYYPERVVERAHAKGLDTPSWWRDKVGSLAMLIGILSRDVPGCDATGAPVGDLASPCAPDGDAAALRVLARWGASPRASEAFDASVDALVGLGMGERVLAEYAGWVRRLCSGPLHMLGDIWDRGARGDLVMRTLMRTPETDVQWGNHDVCWMGAAAGDPTCIATLLRNNLRYGNVEQFEQGYGISLSPLRDFAGQTYRDEGQGVPSPVIKAINVLLFKSEGQAIRRHPEWHMESRMLLGRIDPIAGTVDLDGRAYPLNTTDFPTVDLSEGGDPYAFDERESALMDRLVAEFVGSDELRRQVQWLYDHGGVYKVIPGTPAGGTGGVAEGSARERGGYLLIHGCVPMCEDGTLAQLDCGDRTRAGRELLDWTERVCRRAWEGRERSDLDWMGFFWTGWQSTFMGRVVKTFERTYLADKSTWAEPEDPYYALTKDDPAPCELVLSEFGCDPERDVIVNGHTPVKLPKGQSPVRGGGKRLVIDGGFCKAYRASTGIAGYTLIDDEEGVRLVTHGEFAGVDAALDEYVDMEHTTQWLNRR